MENQCGKCGEDVTGLCDAYYHIGRDYSGVSRTEMNNLFTKGVAIWICPSCRNKFDGNCVRNMLKMQAACLNMQSQIAQLRQLVEELAAKVGSHCDKPLEMNPGVTGKVSGGEKVKQNREGSNRSYGNNSTNAPAPMKGTKSVDSSNLTVCNIISKPKFWLYLTGFRPLVSNDDVLRFVKEVLESDEEMHVVKLVAKNADLSRLNFVSFKIGLDSGLKEKALASSKWPTGIALREFENCHLPKTGNSDEDEIES